MSDTKKQMFKRAFIYLLISLFCILFNYIYGLFGHGVTSNYMTYMFLYPLILGTIIYLFFGLTKLKKPDRISINTYNGGIATLTVGSVFHGVFEIAGTTSPYQMVFGYAGIVLIAIAISNYILKKSNNS